MESQGTLITKTRLKNIKVGGFILPDLKITEKATVIKTV